MEIQKEVLVKTLKELKSKGFDYLKFITAVDYLDRLEVIYLLYNTTNGKDEIIKVKIPFETETQENSKNNSNDDSDGISITTIMHIYPAADWYERELSEMFGITISNRKTTRLLLENWNGIDHPLRKKFIWGQDYKKEI